MWAVQSYVEIRGTRECRLPGYNTGRAARLVDDPRGAARELAWRTAQPRRHHDAPSVAYTSVGQYDVSGESMRSAAGPRGARRRVCQCSSAPRTKCCATAAHTIAARTRTIAGTVSHPPAPVTRFHIPHANTVARSRHRPTSIAGRLGSANTVSGSCAGWAPRRRGLSGTALTPLFVGG